MNGDLNDGYGEQPCVDTFLADAEGWLIRRAHRLCITPAARSRLDDVKQEGRIELWRALRETGDTEAAFARAHYKMLAVARREILQTGQEPRARDTKQPADTDSVDRLATLSVWDYLFAVDALEGVEMAYHHGEIMAALDTLTERQRRYVIARFWCGMDTTGGLHMNPGVKHARDNNPDMRRDILWTGSKTTPGAKRRLAEALAHLAGV